MSDDFAFGTEDGTLGGAYGDVACSGLCVGYVGSGLRLDCEGLRGGSA